MERDNPQPTERREIVSDELAALLWTWPAAAESLGWFACGVCGRRARAGRARFGRCVRGIDLRTYGGMALAVACWRWPSLAVELTGRMGLRRGDVERAGGGLCVALVRAAAAGQPFEIARPCPRCWSTAIELTTWQRFSDERVRDELALWLEGGVPAVLEAMGAGEPVRGAMADALAWASAQAAAGARWSTIERELRSVASWARAVESERVLAEIERACAA